jgi:hypothetical protein
MRRGASSIPIASSRSPDTLCPATARLAAGTALDELGDRLDPGTLAVVTVPEPEIEYGKICCEVIDFNRRLDGVPALSVEAVAGSAQARRGNPYADFAAGEYGVLFDPRG